MTCRRTLGWGWLLSGLAGLALAQDRGVDVVDADGQRVVRYATSHALLIGVSDYTAGWDDLPSVPGELEQVRAALEKHAFETRTIRDPGEDALRKAVKCAGVGLGFLQRLQWRCEGSAKQPRRDPCHPRWGLERHRELLSRRVPRQGRPPRPQRRRRSPSREDLRLTPCLRSFVHRGVSTIRGPGFS